MILTYLIKSTLCLAVLFGFYKVALENKAMHQFKRFYLLASLVFAFTIPLVTFTYTTTPTQEIYDEKWIEDFARGYNAVPPSSSQIEEIETEYTSIIIWSLYGLGVLIFGVRFGLNLVRLKRKINTSQQLPKEGFTLSLLEKSIVPHSFLKWIFLNKTAYQNQEIAPAVLAHEATHVREKHSWDILFIEFLQIFFWFNPFIWVSKKSIKLNHEFLADQGAIASKSNIAIYQNILLSYASSAHHTALESPFNYSLTKKRIVMMSQTFSRKRAIISTLLLLPIIAGCLFLFNNKIIAQERDPNKIQYAKNYLAGAQRNGKKALVITARNNQVYLNGGKSSLGTFVADVDAYTRDWKQTDYTNAQPSILIQPTESEFVKALDTEFLKTNFSIANGNFSLIPPMPPTPPKPQDLSIQKARRSTQNHLFKMNTLGGEFYYNTKKITYKKAQRLLKNNTSLNVNTPYPYSSPPKTFISDSAHIANQQPATKKEIAVYNRIAKKYNKNPNGEIKKAEVDQMSDIYARMTAAQKKTAQPYPELPPPPPPAPEKLNPGDTLTITINDTGEKHQVIIEETKKDTVKPKFKFSNTKESINQGTQFVPDFSVYPQNQDQLAVEIHSPRTLNWDGMLFFENDVELTKSEAGSRIASDNYFMDIGKVIPGTSKQKVVLTKKPWAQDANSQGNHWAITTEYKEAPSRESHLTSLIERHALSNGIFEMNDQIISKEDAIQSIKQQNISLEVRYRNGKPFKMILNKDHITASFDIYYEGKLLNEDEYNALAGKSSLELKKLKEKTDSSKAQFELVRRQ